MSRIPVIVTSVGGNVGQGVIKSLRAAPLDFRIIGVDMEPLSAGFSFADTSHVVPASGAMGFEAQMAAICQNEGVQAIFVCSDAEILYFAAQRDRLESQLGCRILVNPLDVVQTAKDKLRTAQFLADAGLPHARTTHADDVEGTTRLIEACGWPLIAKPRIGATSKNVFRVNSHEQLAAVRTLVPDLVIQEYLPDNDHEYTAGTVSDADRNVRATIVLRRDLVQGTTYRTELVENADWTAQVARIVNTLGAIGPCNVQFRVVNNNVVPFEINPRFSGTSGIRFLYGFNDPELVFRALCRHEKVNPPAVHPGVALRYWDEVFLHGKAFVADEQRHDAMNTPPTSARSLHATRR